MDRRKVSKAQKHDRESFLFEGVASTLSALENCKRRFVTHPAGRGLSFCCWIVPPFARDFFSIFSYISRTSYHRRHHLRQKYRQSSASDQTRRKIEQMELKREERRILADAKREERKEQTAKLRAVGNTGDVDYTAMVEEWRKNNLPKGSQRHDIVGYLPTSSSKITVAVRKRPMSDKEWNKGDHESATCHHPNVTIHTPKVKVDGIQKSMTHATYQFDYSFGDDSSTDQIYVSTTMPIVDYVLETNKRGTIFAYGQTGSGKTFTMGSIQRILANDLFLRLKELGMNVDVSVAIFEIYDGSVQDLLNGRHQCKVLEDGKGQVHVTGLKEFPARSPEEFLKIVEDGHSQRTTHATEANDSSSRSHAICQVFLREKVPSKKREKALKGKLTLVDLAGSERGSDTKLHNSQRRAESADINTSLLALKECIRDLGQNKSHVRYRQSELTKILKDSFSADSKTTMIVTISPGSSATDHSLNTCRYAQHLKERKVSCLNLETSIICC
jgi:kinesin family protein 2/24